MTIPVVIGRTVRILLVLALFGIAACAEVPKESVELSATVGRDLVEVHRANRELAVRYFDRIEGDINEFVDDIYRPHLIREMLLRDKLLDRLRPATASNASSTELKDAFDELDLFVDVVSQQLQAYRQKLLDPIEKQKADMLLAIDNAFENLQNANAIVTAHLASVAKVHDAQAELLDKAGLGGFKEKFVDTTVSLSDDVEGLLERAKKGDEKIDDVSEKLNELVAKFRAKQGS
jgi:hypothetical protein